MASVKPDARPHLLQLTGMRFFAAALVFFNHFGREATTSSPVWVQQLLLHGRSAVTFFFMLSGFVLAYSYIDDRSGNGMRSSRKRFYFNRFARIYPVYFLALLPALTNKSLSVVGGTTDPKVLLDFPIAASLLQAWVPAWAAIWNPPAWSLSVETFFYAVFPFLALWLRSVRSAKLLAVVVPVALVMAWSRIAIQEWNDALGAFFPLFHLPTFVLGYAVARALIDYNGRVPNGNLAFAVSIAFLSTHLAFGFRWASPHLVEVILQMLFAILIFSLATVNGRLRQCLSIPILVLLGEASYSLYITHMPVMALLEKMAAASGLWQTPRAQVSFVLLGFGCCTALSVTLFLKFEKPMQRWLLAVAPRRQLTGLPSEHEQVSSIP